MFNNYIGSSGQKIDRQRGNFCARLRFQPQRLLHVNGPGHEPGLRKFKGKAP